MRTLTAVMGAERILLVSLTGSHLPDVLLDEVDEAIRTIAEAWRQLR